MKVVVFAKAPVAGQVKSRLAGALGPDGAAELHRRLVRRTLKTARDAQVGPVELSCAPDIRHGFFADCAAEFGVSLAAQGDGDLGARMSRAFERDAPAVLIGCDCPARTADDLIAAARALASADAVVTPAEDGGYVLIGLRAAAPGLFAGIEWGASEVMARTRERAASLGLALHELPASWDVDRAADLDRVAALDPALLAGLR
jgi:rSAM/selenodomain-associated transferase 1